MKMLLSRFLVVIILFSLFGCTNVKKERKIKKDNKDKIDEIINNMTLEEKIGQLLIIDYDSDKLTENMIDKIKTTPPSGFILLKNNITTYEKTKKLVSDMKSNSKYPMIISIDEEGGNVQRLKNLSDREVTDIPFMNDLGAINDDKLTYEIGRVIAEELRTIGVNLDFAPDIDIYSNVNNKVIGKRSFSSDPYVVATQGINLSKGLLDNKVLPVFKHFPGHGDTDVDSHNHLPIINKSIDELKSLEFIPFIEAVKSDAKMIMVGHIAIPSVTGDLTPSSLSKKVIDILKEDIKFDGLIVTDALNMGALTENYSNEEIYVKALEAGCDLLLMPKDGIDTIDLIKDKVSEERIDKSLKKILKYKYDYLNDNTLDYSYLASDEHKKIVSKVYGN